MNDNVTPINKPKEISVLRNLAKCMSCKHEWQAEAPLGTVWLDCPACTLNCGRFIGTVSYEGDHWHCNCGNNLFYITPTKTYCPCCGVICGFK